MDVNCFQAEIIFLFVKLGQTFVKHTFVKIKSDWQIWQMTNLIMAGLKNGEFCKWQIWQLANATGEFRIWQILQVAKLAAGEPSN